MIRSTRLRSAIVVAPAIMLAVFSFVTPTGEAADNRSNTAIAVIPTVNASVIAQHIDRAIESKLGENKVKPAPLADDGEFLRRVYLDLTGVIPPAATVAAFLQDKAVDKRAKLIDELIASPRFGLHLADQWENLLMLRDSTNRRLKSQPLYDWLASRFNKNSPWNKTVSDLLTSTGTQEENGATTFFIALRTPEKLNDQVTRLFLGVQLQCAQCHNHPFAKWKREDYWSMAAFYSKVRAGGKKVGLAKNGIESVNEDGKGKKAPDPESALKLPPKYLGAALAELKKDQPYRPALAKWITAPENPYFAQAMVNRTWSQFFGRGIATPVDGVADATDVSHSELLAALSKEFVACGFDVKMLIRGICNSQTYQRVSGPAGKEGASDDALYARMKVKPLTPEQLYDSLASVLGTLREEREGRKGGAKAGPTFSRAKFIEFFDVPDGADTTEYTTGIPQVLQLMNSSPMNQGAALIDEIMSSKRNPEQNLERLYLATLSRQPSGAEVARLVQFLKVDPQNLRGAYTDILWVLLNSSEFALNH